MMCPNCDKEMTIENVETRPAHQGLVNGEVDIVSPESEDMWWCDECHTTLPIKSERDDFDYSDEARGDL